MLKEAQYVRRYPGEPKKRWFSDDFFDLILWMEEDEIVSFQLCYDRHGEGRAITWNSTKGYSHHGVDDGEHGALKPKATPIMVPDGVFNKDMIYSAFAKSSAEIDPTLSKFVLERIKNYQTVIPVAKPAQNQGGKMALIDINELGPLKNLVGTFKGNIGDDIAPSDDRGTENNKYHEVIVFTHILPAVNHEQTLYSLRYHQQVFRHGEEFPFHDQVGYWHWDPQAKQVMQSLTIPRGMAVLAGGQAENDSKSLHLKAQLGSKTFGICSNPFLDKEFQTVEYEIRVDFPDENTLVYDQITKIQMKGQSKIFEHRDKNTLKRSKT
jgi:hypothetical protein